MSRTRSIGAVVAALVAVAAMVGTAHAGEALWRILFFWRSPPASAPAAAPEPERGLNQRVANRALKEALALAAAAAISDLSRPGGFRDGPRAIALPEPLGDAQLTLREVGRSGPLDQLQAETNAAAERASAQLAEPLAQEIAELPLPDAVALVRGDPEAGTRYLRLRAEARLTERLRPHMAEAIGFSGAGASVENAARAARAPSRAENWRERLIDYATERTIAAVFDEVAAQEAAVRANPARHASDAMRRAFSAGA